MEYTWQYGVYGIIMNELELMDILQDWCIKSTSPHKTEEYKNDYQHKLDRVIRYVETMIEGCNKCNRSDGTCGCGNKPECSIEGGC